MRKRIYIISFLLIITLFSIILKYNNLSEKKDTPNNTITSETNIFDSTDTTEEETQYITVDDNDNPITLPYSSEDSTENKKKPSGIIPLQ